MNIPPRRRNPETKGGKGGSQILLRDLHSRIVSVTDDGVGHLRSGGGQSLGVFVEHDISLSLDELKKGKVRISKEVKERAERWGRDSRPPEPQV